MEHLQTHTVKDNMPNKLRYIFQVFKRFALANKRRDWVIIFAKMMTFSCWQKISSIHVLKSMRFKLSHFFSNRHLFLSNGSILILEQWNKKMVRLIISQIGYYMYDYVSNYLMISPWHKHKRNPGCTVRQGRNAPWNVQCKLYPLAIVGRNQSTF